MFEKLRNLFSSTQGNPSPQDKAKAVYFVLVSHGNTVVKDILSSSPQQFKDSNDFKAFLRNEVGVIMCLNSTREGYDRFFTDSEESKLFAATLFSLFKNNLQISWDVLKEYINVGENTKEPDKLFIRLFASRIVAFLNRDDDLMSEKGEKIMVKYSFSPETIIYGEYYTRIFELVALVLKEYAGESANSRKILEMSKKLDGYVR